MNTVISGHMMAKIEYTYLHCCNACSRMGGWGRARGGGGWGKGRGEDGEGMEDKGGGRVATCNTVNYISHDRIYPNYSRARRGREREEVLYVRHTCN